jgi:hypothetical protein
MNLKQTVYFMALVGALAGLVAWILQIWVLDQLTAFKIEVSQETVQVFVTVITGALIGGLTVGFADHWTAERVVAHWVAAGAVLGAIAGAASSLLYGPMLRIMQASSSSPAALLGRPLTWLVTGGLIGLVTGLRWFKINRLRAIHALLGGLIGGGVGGVLFTFLGEVDFFQALAYMVTGTGITLGVTLAPVLMRDGVLQFISSADARAQNKYGSPQQEWVIQEGDRFVIGSQGTERGMTMYARPVDVYIPDALIGRRHAVLFAKNKRFYIQHHSDNIGPQGQALTVLQVNRSNVATTRELRSGDDLLLGQTLLRFYSRKQPEAPRAFAPGV